ncbi:hypothetical protein ABEV79_14895 [Bacillus licheniformis]|uniref:hypothetical protein n=1 Tax=Bacillus sonorensis TaxID=119858 RepID=UPI002DBB14DE|nr:hypothetical protein [Bacillus sonorensis]MEC1440555.1 hypothetical protein [Bacillus sonorensis]
MKIRLHQQVCLKDNLRDFRTLHKEFESNVIPHKGDFIADSLYKDPYEIEVGEVHINYQRNECNVFLHRIELESNSVEALEDYVDIGLLHDWTCDFRTREK